MAVADAHLMLASLNLTDTPIGYAAPLGPAVFFTATYNQREASQPTVIDYSNLGSKWVHNWLSYVEEGAIPSSGSAVLSATIRLPGGGSESYTSPSMSVSPIVYPYPFNPQAVSRVKLEKLTSTSFRVTQPDGSQMTFGRRTGVVGAYRYFLTVVADATGQAAQLSYDAQNRLVAITDAIGQVTTFSYEFPADSLKITKVTDPFGREANFAYDASGRLVSITDIIGIQSQFSYSGTSDFIQSLTTPYGTSTFSFGEGNSGLDRWLEIKDPLGGIRRIEARNDWPSLPGVGPQPIGMNTSSGFQNFRNTLYWDKKATHDARGDVSAAHIFHWLHTAMNLTSGTLENEKAPYENRIFYNYEGQTNSIYEGASSRPIAIGRVLDDGTTQLTRYEYNAYGRVTKRTDPAGRVTTFIYDTNGIDLLEVRQLTGPNPADYEVLSKGTYNGSHQALTATDAAGQTTAFTYNAAGQLSTVTNAKSEVVRYFYDPDGDPAGSRLGNGDRDAAGVGYLVAVDGPLAGSADTVTYAYDGYGRLRTATDTEGYAITTDYDAFDRPTVITFPDNSYQQLVYDRFDAIKVRDRRGRWTRRQFNALRQLITATDPLGRTTQFNWCACGALTKLVDPRGLATTWDYDVQGRTTAKNYPDGSSVRFTYENTTSRLKTVTDPKGQVTNYAYYVDNSLKEVSYSNATFATPTVSYTYDSHYPRATSRTDGVGTTSYAYNPIPTTPTLGAGALASVDGPLDNDTITYTYDELGRVVGTAIDGTANSMGTFYDALGRVSSATNALGTFTYAYVNATGRVEHMDYPNGQRTNYSYFGNTGDHRLQQIANLKADTSNLSTFVYTYDADGVIQTWSRQIDGGPVLTSTFKYDAIDQLTEAVVPQDASANKAFIYRYDASGNRTSEQIDHGVTTATVNNLNQVTALSASGPIRFEGSLGEPGTVTINATSAIVAVDNSFKADVPLTPGTQTVTVTATDAANNSVSKSYQVTVADGASRTLSYDANGNLVNDGAGKVYEWDAADRLLRITQGANVTEFVYDGADRRVAEKLNGAVIRRWVWFGGPQPVEERDDSNTVTRRFYGGLGQQIGADLFYYVTDHLGSVRDMTDGTGALRARYEYDPYGRSTRLAGDLEPDFGFSGFFRQQDNDILLTRYRPYDPELGRWIGRDPLHEIAGANLYVYVGNSPIIYIDPYGQVRWGQLGRGTAALGGAVLGTVGLAAAEISTGGLATAGVVVAAGTVATGYAYGIGNIVAAFGKNDRDAKWMEDSPGSIPQVAARALGGQNAQNVIALVESIDSVSNAVGKLESVRSLVENADAWDTTIRGIADQNISNGKKSCH